MTLPFAHAVCSFLSRYGRYNMGPRSRRGGMAHGWAGRSDGHILKINGTYRRLSSDDNVRTTAIVKLPADPIMYSNHFRFQMWVHIVKGAVEFGTDVGTGYSNRITAADCAEAPDGWLFVDQVIRLSHTANPRSSWTFVLKPTAGGADRMDGDFEVYVALPYLATVQYNGGRQDSGQNGVWAPSVKDLIDMDYHAKEAEATATRIAMQAEVDELKVSDTAQQVTITGQQSQFEGLEKKFNGH
jgi:hypothetical protein